MRLDKFIANNTLLSRLEAKKVIKKGVLINDILVKDSKYDVCEDSDVIKIEGKIVEYNKYVYLMLNKPQGVVTATEDNVHLTVIDLIAIEDRILKPFPVGRLDKDTEGLLLLTNDGELAHRLLSPKKNVFKKYYVEVDGLLTEEIIKLFKKGVIIDKDYLCKESYLTILEANTNKSSAYIEISEGKFHQIKKMMRAVNLNVTYLKRETMGDLKLDVSLPLGSYRKLTEEEIKKLKNVK